MNLRTVDQSMFASTPLNPPDAIFGLNEDFKKDDRPNKVNLTVGVYQDDSGKTPTLQSVREAEKRLWDESGTKSYLPIDGLRGYNGLIGNLILGDELCPVSNEVVRSTSVHSVTAQTPGGTAALRVAGDFLSQVGGAKSIWISNPTWANHRNIFTSAGLEIREYEYLDDCGTGLDFDRVLESLRSAEPGDAILLHTVCHNPTGVDLSRDQWSAVLELVLEKSLVPVFDFAYQGFGAEPEQDAAPIREFCLKGGEGMICNSFSKNFGLYGERVGGLTVVTQSRDSALATLSQLKRLIRTSYSNPPLHGASIVNKVLGDAELKAQWLTELAAMRNRILELRGKFVDIVNDITPDRDFEYIKRQVGMFSYSGMTQEQVAALTSEHAIYALGTGRINIAGLNSGNIDRVCGAIAKVMNS